MFPILLNYCFCFFAPAILFLPSNRTRELVLTVWEVLYMVRLAFMCRCVALGNLGNVNIFLRHKILIKNNNLFTSKIHPPNKKMSFHGPRHFWECSHNTSQRVSFQEVRGGVHVELFSWTQSTQPRLKMTLTAEILTCLRRKGIGPKPTILLHLG